MKRRLNLLGYGAFLALVGLLVAATDASALSISSAYHYTNNYGPNPIPDRFPEGPHIIVGADIFDLPVGETPCAESSFDPGTCYPLRHWPDPIFPNDYTVGIPFDSDLAANGWTIRAGDKSAFAGPNVPPVAGGLMGLAEDIHIIPNGLTPKVSWTLPTNFSINLIQLRVLLDDAIGTQIWTTNLPGDAAMFELPVGALTGADDYLFRIIVRGDGGNRSSAFSESYTVVPLPAAFPLFVTGLLGLGLMARNRHH